MKEEKFPHSRKPSHKFVCGEFWNLRQHYNWAKKKKNNNPQITCLTATASGEVHHICHQRVGAGQGGAGCIMVLRVRIRPECPGDNLRELM